MAAIRFSQAMDRPSITRLALVDDHVVVRRALAALLNTYEGFHVVLEANNGVEFTEALTAGTAEQIDIAVVDLRMPAMDGYQTMQWVSAHAPTVRCLALTFEGHEDAIIRAVRAGARAFVRKDVEPEQLYHALCSVRDTGYSMDDAVHHAVVEVGGPKTTFERQRAKIVAALTERDLEFVELICAPEEYTYEEIADRMRVKVATIDTHRKNIFERFGLKSKTGLVLFAYRWQLVPVPAS
jgi:two-component system, NarL family, invasion response regulator UvrY